MKELAGRLERMKQELNGFPQWADAKLGVTALAMFSQRIITKGETSDGGSFSAYSTKPMLVGAKSFRTKAAANSVFGRTNKENNQWRTIKRGDKNYKLILLPSGYKELRRIETSQVGHKSFLRTGEMWGSIHYQPADNMTINKGAAIKVEGTTKQGEGKFITEIGSKNDLTNKKLEGHSKREGKDIMMLNKKEEAFLDGMLDTYLTEILNRAING